MSTEFKFLILLVGFLYGLICTTKPMWVASSIARFTKFGLGGSLLHSNLKLQTIISLIEQGGDEYMKAYPNHIARIKLTGVVALLVTSIGLCMLTVNLT